MEIINSQNISMHPIKNYSVFIIYLFINVLFIVKYGENYNVLFLIGYLILFFSLSNVYIKITLKDILYKYLFLTGIIFFFFFTVYLNYKIDGNSLNVDRWSAMEVGIKAIFNGKYPYNIPDHMGQESSNLPALTLFGMPFYVLFGSVGYLQSFSFLLFAYLVFKIFDDYKKRLAVLILLFLSPSYLWEIYVKSDLFSNFIIIAGFTYLVWKKFLKEKQIRLEIVSFLATLVLLTRLSSVIPLTILLFRNFYNFSVKEKLVFIVIFILTMSITCYIFFHNVPNFTVFMKHNPFLIQGAKQPLVLSISYIVLAFLLSFKVKSFYETMFWSGVLLFICVFVPFIMFFIEYGYENMITNSFFDISFFNMCMPFIMIALAFGFFENNKESL